MLASLPQTLNISCPYVVIKFGSGTSMVTKPTLYLMALVLLSPQIGLNLFHAMGQLPQCKTLTLEQLWPDSRQLITISNAAVCPLMVVL